MVHCEVYSETDLDAIRRVEGDRQLESKLAFEYKHLEGASDKDALYKYRDVIKGFARINSTGVWNWTTILGGMKKWDSKNLGRLLSTSRTHGMKAVHLAASNLATLLQDARNAKRNMKTGSRTPHWMMDIIENIEVKVEPKGRGNAAEARPPTIGESWSVDSPEPPRHSCGSGRLPRPSSGSATLKRKRSLKFCLSTTSEEPMPHTKKSLLAIQDDPDIPQGEEEEQDDDDIEDTNCEKFVYDWDEVSNKGKRMKPGGRWVLCNWQEKDRTSGFMKCFWKAGGDIESWTSEMTILEYESNEPPEEVRKRPAAAMKKPAAAIMKKPAGASKGKKLDPQVRKREHSRIYHQTFDRAIARGDTDEVSKAKAREAAMKHIHQLISKL